MTKAAVVASVNPLWTGIKFSERLDVVYSPMDFLKQAKGNRSIKQPSVTHITILSVLSHNSGVQVASRQPVIIMTNLCNFGTDKQFERALVVRQCLVAVAPGGASDIRRLPSRPCSSSSMSNTPPLPDDYPSANQASPSSAPSILHPTSSSATGSAVPSFLAQNPPAIFAAQPAHQSDRHEISLSQPSTQFSQLQFAQAPSDPPPHSATNITHADATRFQSVHSLPSPQFIHDPTGLPQSPLPHPLTQALTTQGPIYYGQGMFSGSHHFSLQGSTFIDNSTIADNFMKDLLEQTIIGAEFDSSDRDPPPRCHPGTRLAILQRCLDFIIQCHDEGKLRWVVGPAGVGKSAVMQIVAEKAPDGVIFVSVFLSVNGRQDGSKTIVTIAYQLAVKCEPYRHFLRNEVTKDPSLARKSLSVQFQKFIVEPFIRQRIFDPQRRFLVLIDGLDECDSVFTQQELLRLISDFCISNPASPIAWIVASRPEPHITSFFDDVNVAPAYTKEEMVVDSEEACEDVQRYLHSELNKIKLAYPTLQRKRQWPSEHDFTKIATAASGLFAYASTVVRYIGDPHCGDPVAQLNDVLMAIDGGQNDDASGTDGPLAQLDVLYGRILSKIPDKVMVNTRKLLLLCLGGDWTGESFRVQCNLLGLTEDAAYAAIRHLYSVVKVSESDDEPIEFFHKSFKDYLCDFERSRFSLYIYLDARKLANQISLRIIKEVPDSEAEVSQVFSCRAVGLLRGDPSTCNAISLSWPGDERFAMADEELKLKFYADAMENISSNFYDNQNMFSFQVLTTRFAAPGYYFPFDELRSFAFDELRHELKELGKFKAVPLRTLDYAAIWGQIHFRFTSPIGKDVVISDPWNPSCSHEMWKERDPQQLRQSTHFYRYRVEASPRDPTDIPRFSIASIAPNHSKHFAFYSSANVRCRYCLQRLARYFMNNPDQVVTVFIDSTEMCYVELSFVDPDDGVSEWRYQFLHSGLPTCIDV